MTPQEFIAKWRNGGDERRDWHSFFDDLCRLVGHPTPREADPDHTWFTYEYGATKASGGEGWADAWKRGSFGWEAKGTGKDLDRAYAQFPEDMRAAFRAAERLRKGLGADLAPAEEPELVLRVDDAR